MRGPIDGPDDWQDDEPASDTSRQGELPSDGEAAALDAADDPYPGDGSPEPVSDYLPVGAPFADEIGNVAMDEPDRFPQDIDTDTVDCPPFRIPIDFRKFFLELDLTGELRKESSPERGEKSDLAAEERDAFLTGTFKNALIGLVQLAADAHGAGVFLRLARGAVAAVEWLQATEGEKGADVDIPVFVGSLVEVDMSVHLGDGEGPPVTFCCSLTGDSPVGDLNIDGIVFGPGDKLKDEGSREDDESARPELSEAKPVRREQGLGVPRSEARPTKVSETIDLVQEYVTPELLRRAKRQNRFAVWYSVGMFAIVLFYLDGETNPSWQAVIWETDAGQFRMYFDRAGRRASKNQGPA
jgi:hypothetical protein